MVVAAWRLIHGPVVESRSGAVLVAHLQNTVGGPGTVHRHHRLVKARHELAKERRIVLGRWAQTTTRRRRCLRLELRDCGSRRHRVPAQAVRTLDNLMGRIRLLEVGAVVPKAVPAIRVTGLQSPFLHLPQQGAVRCAGECLGDLGRLGHIASKGGRGVEGAHALPRGNLIPLTPVGGRDHRVRRAWRLMLGGTV